MKISIWVVFGILHGCCSVHADCPLCMHVAYKVTNVPPGWIQTLREGLSFVEKLNTCARNEMLTPKCTQGYVCSGYYFLYTAKGLKNVNPDIEMSLEMITRGCESPHTNIGCSPLQGTINS
ncbi:hypothetical protein DPMN_180426 [Dreissena polymorpha]|uniref:Uncharacterized protein n=1 Tax=Dreissena polymorpha TaxID=45954 RepID=A0A9D4EEP2_DREPO|nr:hypothetical protein DPMN_180426 [Dreissena polymorpha]